MNELKVLLDKFEGAKALLIGDIMLDAFIYGDVSRISPEGPIPVLSINKESEMLGGAGNVLANMLGLGCSCDIISIVGDDEAAIKLKKLIEGYGGVTSGLITDKSRPTVLKTRYIAQTQQLLRVDYEKALPVSKEIEDQIIKTARNLMKDKKVLILSDYGKGVITPDLAVALVKLAKEKGLQVIVDSKAKDLTVFKGADIITPNKKELSEATHKSDVKTDTDIERAAHILRQENDIGTVIATRSEDGISVIGADAPLHIKTQVREVYDVSGAGDTVVATIATVISAGGSLSQAAELSNITGGLVVAKIGTAVITAAEVAQALEAKSHAGSSFISPVLEWNDAKAQIKAWQNEGLSVGMTGGCFDIIHYGHVHYFANTRARCDKLIVALNSDASIRILKGPTRPVNDEMARSAVIAALGSCDMVVFFGANNENEDNTPYEILETLQPDVFFKGGDYTVDQLPEAKAVLEYGGKVEIMPLYQGYSTTNIIEKAAKK